jgi:MFS family permease
MPSIAAQPVFIASILARLPLAMLTIGMLVHVQHVTGSFAAAGLVSGTLAVAQGAGGPALGRLVDRRGQTAVLIAGALVSGAALVATALLPAGAPLTALIALATVIGLASPPVGPCMRSLLPGMVEDEASQRGAYSACGASAA